MKNLSRVLFILIVLCIIAASCGKDDESNQTDLLCREWEVISIDGMSLDELSDETFQLFYLFEVNGDCSETLITGGVSVGITGKWKWTDDEKTVEMEFESEGEKLTDVLKVQKLTADEFWFTAVVLSDSSESLLKCEPK